MAKVEIEFPSAGFESPEIIFPIPLGRLHLGDHVARWVFSQEGRPVLLIPRGCLDDGSVQVIDGVPNGFGPAGRKSP